ncbi:MAG: hypothetical protein HFI70_17415 [Lachnospiraceae bacterium]|nr:hypothetical protein [Lachnospiraceae bacterium]
MNSLSLFSPEHRTRQMPACNVPLKDLGKKYIPQIQIERNESVLMICIQNLFSSSSRPSQRWPAVGDAGSNTNAKEKEK